MDVLQILFDPDGAHQLERIEDLVCGSRYSVFLSACSAVVDSLGGCSSEINATAPTAPCSFPPPPPIPPTPSVPAPDLTGLEPPSRSPLEPPPEPEAHSRGCKDPGAATYDALAPIHDAAQCIPGVWGCTLPTALNRAQGANLNDGSCQFPPSRCAVPLAVRPFLVGAGTTTWPARVNASANGVHGCAITPSVSFERCITLVPPTLKSRDVVISFALPPTATEATVEVGIDPHAGRSGNAEFELRAVTNQGEVIASDLAIRARTGRQSLPALLRVQVGMASAAVLQLVVNNQDGDAADDLIVWGNPLLYCEGACPCTAGSDESAVAKSSDPTSDERSAAAAGKALPTGTAAAGKSSMPGFLAALGIGGIVVSAGFVCAFASYRGHSRSSHSRIVGAVQIVRHDDGDKLALMDDCEEEDIPPTATRVGSDDAIPANSFLQDVGWNGAHGRLIHQADDLSTDDLDGHSEAKLVYLE